MKVCGKTWISETAITFPEQFGWIDIAQAFDRSRSWSERLLARMLEAGIVQKIKKGTYAFKGEQ